MLWRQVIDCRQAERRINMTARQEVLRIGIELFCRYSMFRTRFAGVLQKWTILRGFIEKGCADAAVATLILRKVSGAQRVLEIIRKSEKGEDPLSIRRVTGFDEHKIARILYKLFKRGEIRIESGGLYHAAAIR
jgi:hypothetical protein